MKFTPISVDIAKYVMQLHWVDIHTDEVIDKPISRDAFLEYFANRSPA